MVAQFTRNFSRFRARNEASKGISILYFAIMSGELCAKRGLKGKFEMADTHYTEVERLSVSEVQNLRRLDERLRWLASWTIHNANHVRPSRDGVKVGGHQASCASLSTILAVLYFRNLAVDDRVAVKPHASPIYHAIQYLFGRQTRDQLERFRSFGGAQSYPSRTKDIDDVDFSTGSVGLGVAITAFASLTQDYIIEHGWGDPTRRGRMISLLGDAELDEGNIYEALIESYKHDIRNTWWIVDYNRQSLDAPTTDRMFARFDDIFSTAGWEVVTLKYGKAQREAFTKRGGTALKEWIDTAGNADYAALTYSGGTAWRTRLLKDIGRRAGVADLLDSYDDDGLAELMTGLGGHCIETIHEAFQSVSDDCPRLFIAYTVKGYGLPFQGHKDNHAGLMNPTQIASYRSDLGIEEGDEWNAFSGLNQRETGELEAFITEAPFAGDHDRRHSAPQFAPPSRQDFPVPSDVTISTQAAFGKIMHELSRQGGDFADRLVTTSPDVTVSTNLGGFVNQRGLFRRTPTEDVFQAAKIPSAQKWSGRPVGQHIELGIAENNLFTLLGALGLSHSLFGERLLPIGTLYDPFIARGLDALNYACYQDARFMLVSTPSGITLGPEGGAHQSIGTPMIGIAQPGLSYFEPGFSDELAEIMRWGFIHMQDEDGGSVYLRLSTRPMKQIERRGDDWRRSCIDGGYWMKPPTARTQLAIAYTGVVVPEVLDAREQLLSDFEDVAVLAVTSADRLHAGWVGGRRQRWEQGRASPSHIEILLDQLPRSSGLVTVLDGAHGTLSWMAGVKGHMTSSLGIDRFGQVGDTIDLYSHYRIDAAAIIDASADLILERLK